MKFKIHDRTWRVTQDGDGENVYIRDDGDSRLGLCCYLERRIYIHESLRRSDKRQTLMHELTHAMIYEYALPQEMGEEQVCDFVATYADEVITIADRYMKKSIKK